MSSFSITRFVLSPTPTLPRRGRESASGFLPPPTGEGWMLLPPPPEGEGGGGGASWSAWTIASHTPSELSNTSLFQNRNTRIPLPCRNDVRCASCARPVSSLCCPPSISTASLCSRQ